MRKVATRSDELRKDGDTQRNVEEDRRSGDGP